MLNLLMVFQRAACHTLSNAFEGLFDCAPSFSETFLFFGNNVFCLLFQSVEQDFEQYLTGMTDETDSFCNAEGCLSLVLLI